MNRLVLSLTLILTVLGADASFAGPRCDVPLSEWQPSEALQSRLEAEGWKVNRIRTDDGCYKVYAMDDKGNRYEGKFDPRTLKAVKTEIEHLR